MANNNAFHVIDSNNSLNNFEDMAIQTLTTESTVLPSSEYNATYDNGSFELATAGSKYVCLTTQEVSLTLNIASICVGLVIILGNFLVLFVLFRFPSRNFTPFNWLLCHLAVADFVIGVTVFWWYGLAEVLSIPVTNLQKVGFYGSSIVSVLASLEGLMTIAMDRYYLILRQRSYSTTITKRRLAIAIVAMWVFPLILEVIVPLSGWSCVDDCDCRIHNVRPDDVYCFGEQCSQILPPLTKHQLSLTGIISCVLFVVTISLYIVIFNGVKRQTNKLRQHMSPKFSNGPPKFQVHSSPGSPKLGGWRNNPTSLNERGTPTPRPKQELRFNTVNKAFEMSEDDLAAGTSLNRPKPNVINGLMMRQDSNTTTATELSLSNTPTPTIESVQFQETVNENRDSKTEPKSGVNGSIPKVEHSTVTVIMRPKTLRINEAKTEENRKSLSTFINRLTRRSKRRTTASQKRDLRVMKSMFMILSVFVATTAPLMIFVIYTLPHNDRDLKEIFVYLLQVTTLNSLLNPFLYFWRIPHMRKKLKLLVHSRQAERRWRQSSFWKWRHTERRPSPNKPKKEVSDPSWESTPSEGSVKN